MRRFVTKSVIGKSVIGLFVLTVGLVILPASTPPAFATTVQISVNNGGIDQPGCGSVALGSCQTIGYAIGQADLNVPNNIDITVAPGLYPEDRLNPPANTTIEGVGSGQALVSPEYTGSSVFDITQAGDQISNLEIDNGGGPGSATSPRGCYVEGWVDENGECFQGTQDVGPTMCAPLAVQINGNCYVTGVISESGGAVNVATGGQVTLLDDGFEGNQACGGGAVWDAGSVSIQGSTFDNSTADQNGNCPSENYPPGAIAVAGGTLSSLGGNYVRFTQGAGVTVSSGGVFIGSIYDVIAFNTGDGVDNTGGMVTLGTHLPQGLTEPNDVITGNGGNGVTQNGGTTTLQSDTINQNNGAGISNTSGTININDSTVSGNLNGGISNAASLVMVDDTISGNSGSASGGGLNNSGTASLLSDTVGSNSATVGGELSGTSGSVTYIGATIVGPDQGNGKVSNPVCNIDSGATFSDGAHNVQSDASCGLNTSGYGDVTWSSADGTMLGLLTNNGGPTDTMMPQPTLRCCAPPTPGTGLVLNAIPTTYSLNFPYNSGIPVHPCGPTTDQRSVSRPQLTDCDKGAVELGGPFLTLTDKPCTTKVCGGGPNPAECCHLGQNVNPGNQPQPGSGGSGSGGGSQISFYWDTRSSKPFATTKEERNQKFGVHSKVPPLPFGPHTVIAVNSRTGVQLTAGFTISPSLITKGKAGKAGHVVSVTASGFDANSSVVLTWYSPVGPTVGTVSTGPTGYGVGSFTVPNVSDGGYRVYAQDRGGATTAAPFKVKGPAPKAKRLQ